MNQIAGTEVPLQGLDLPSGDLNSEAAEIIHGGRAERDYRRLNQLILEEYFGAELEPGPAPYLRLDFRDRSLPPMKPVEVERGPCFLGDLRDGEIPIHDSATGALKCVLRPLPDNQWMFYHPNQAFYSGAERAHEYAAVRLGSDPEELYPLGDYQKECHQGTNLAKALAGPPPRLKPKRLRRRYAELAASGVLALTSAWLGWWYRAKKKEAVRLQARLLLQERQAREDLETKASELKQSNRAHEEAKETAGKTNRAKSELLANRSHKIRTPLHAILGYAQLLQWDGQLPDSLRPAAISIERGGDHLGCQTIMASSGQEGVDRALEEKPSLVVMDIRMEGMDGVEAARQIQTGLGTDAAALLIVCSSASASAHEEDRY